jgi:hypothetical protein
LNGDSDFASCQLLNDVLRRFVPLTDDLIQTDRLHASLLQLLIRTAGFNGLVLTHITDEQDAISRFKALKKRVHLASARQARFVKDVQPWQ